MMAVTILEALQNADHNLRHAIASLHEAGPTAGALRPIMRLAANQLHNATELLDRGYDLRGTEVELLLARFGDVEAVPPAPAELRTVETLGESLLELAAFIRREVPYRNLPAGVIEILDAIKAWHDPEGE